MTLEQLLQSPEAYAIMVGAWAVNWILKRATRDRSVRKDPNFKLLLSVLPIALGTLAGFFLFADIEGSTEVVRAAAGAGAAAPAVVSYGTLKQISALPWLPAPLKGILQVLLERSETLQESAPQGEEPSA